MPHVSWPPTLPDIGWQGIAASRSGVTEYWVRLPTKDARARFASALSAIEPQMTLRSADEIAGRFAKAPAPYRVFVILTLVVLEVSVINLMRMLLAKATSRAAEIGIHRALGAGRNIIFGRQLAEGVIVSMAGSVVGLALGVPTVAMFDRLIPDSPVALAITPPIVATVLLVCLLAGLVSGIYPAWRVAVGAAHALPGQDMNLSLELGPILRSMRHHKGTFSLLVLEVALGFVMLLHTLILARYYHHLHVQPTGMPEEELVIARRHFLHPRDAAMARAAERADLVALAQTGAPAAAVDGSPLPDGGSFPSVLTRPGDTRQQWFWPLRATPGITTVLGLQVVAGTGLDAVSARRVRRRRRRACC